jgi:hypothetical protein
MQLVAVFQGALCQILKRNPCQSHNFLIAFMFPKFESEECVISVDNLLGSSI